MILPPPRTIYNRYTNVTFELTRTKNTTEFRKLRHIITKKAAVATRTTRTIEIAKISIGMGRTYLVPDRYWLSQPCLCPGHKANIDNKI